MPQAPPTPEPVVAAEAPAGPEIAGEPEVPGEPAIPREPEAPDEPETAAESEPNAWHWGVPSDTGSARCAECGAPMAEGDIFCGECGAVSHAAARQFSQPRDTVVVERIDPPEPLAPAYPAPSDAASLEWSAPVAPPAPLDPVEEDAVGSPAAPPVPPARPAPAHAAPFADVDDVEATRIIGRVAPGERFVLQFSTGESSTVYGSGLIGRNPMPEPGEYFDQLVRVIDPSRSVSKTHLEFGQTEGWFWVLDRYSGNGTIVRQPDAPPVRCLPDKRYRIARGTRVDIGEQFFVVS